MFSPDNSSSSDRSDAGDKNDYQPVNRQPAPNFNQPTNHLAIPNANQLQPGDENQIMDRSYDDND